MLKKLEKAPRYPTEDLNVESRKEIYFLGRLFARLTIETGLPYFRGFILEKKMLLCVILFPLRCRFYKGRLWRLKHILPRNIAPSRKISVGKI